MPTAWVITGAAALAVALALVPRGKAYDPVKRMLDLFLAVPAAIVFAPVMLAAAVTIALDSRGPIFYLADRVGIQGRRIRVWKLRTMVADADRSAKITQGNDSRITRVGRFLRAAKIDELPQLINVIAGSMTLVGPRAESASVVERYYRPEDQVLFEVPPGMTCPGTLYYFIYDEDNIPPVGVSVEDYYAQVSLRTKLAANLHYVRNRCLAYDLRLLAWTVIIIGLKLLGRKPRWLPENMRP